MPVLVPGIVGALIPNLISTGMIGTGVPKYALGVALGLLDWVPKIRVQTVDTGTLGAGKSAPTPLFVPQPLIYTNLMIGAASQGLLGVMLPVFNVGLANGLVTSFGQMVLNTTHPSVGAGGGVAKFLAPPAAVSMISGFQKAGMSGDGPVKKAKALGRALDGVFAVLVMPVVIVGPPSVSPGAGSGFGGIA
jgi:hypothetical protein